MYVFLSSSRIMLDFVQCKCILLAVDEDDATSDLNDPHQFATQDFPTCMFSYNKLKFSACFFGEVAP